MLIDSEIEQKHKEIFYFILLLFVIYLFMHSIRYYFSNNHN